MEINMNLKYRKSQWIIFLGGMLLITGCTHSISDVDSLGQTETPIFPSQHSAVRAEGAFVNKDNLRQVHKGATKAQLYELLGPPHFREGIMGVKEWDYIFHSVNSDKSILTCQYKVLFDKEMKAQNFYSLPDKCTDQLGNDESKGEDFTFHDLNSEELFEFGHDKLSASGLKKISSIVHNLKTNLSQNKRIVITGHTDRIGNEIRNKTLSLARAESVKALMINNGISSSVIETHGRGDKEPRVYCSGGQSEKAITCLSPNRRITISIVDA